MGHKRHKIEIATPQEVERYADGKPEETQSSSAPAEAGAGAGPGAASVAAQTPPADSGPDLAAEVQEWKDKFLRAKADLANYQRRSEKERAEALRYASAGLIRSLLAVLDNLERVIASAEEAPGNGAALLEGVKLTLESFFKVLREANVQRIEAEGMPFDPQVHEAMMEQPSAGHSERTVLKEALKGYRLHDRVLRPARVIVSKPVAPAGDEPAAGGGGSGDEGQAAVGGQ
jgi:molecular chaperone GrpE